MKATLFLILALLSSQLLTDIPTTPVMTLYQFNGGKGIPYCRADEVTKSKKVKLVGIF